MTPLTSRQQKTTIDLLPINMALILFTSIPGMLVYTLRVPLMRQLQQVLNAGAVRLLEIQGFCTSIPAVNIHRVKFA